MTLPALNMKQVLNLLLITLSAVHLPVQANESHLPLIQEAISKFNNTAYEQWHFQVEQVENEEGELSGSIQSYDPNRKEHKWMLLSENGKEPSSRSLKKYHRKIEKRKEKFKPRNFFKNLVLDTINLEKKTDAGITYSFDVVTNEFGEDANQKLKGTLLYNDKRQFIESLTITNKEPFKPQFLVTVSHLTLTLNYQLIQDQVLASGVSMRLQGNMGFIEIDEINEVTFSDYRFFGDSNTTTTATEAM